jgi:hypothetical protein
MPHSETGSNAQIITAIVSGVAFLQTWVIIAYNKFLLAFSFLKITA